MAIRPDTDPKSASPRSGTPKGELEQYGVWVKAEPQDVIEEIAVPGAGDFDFDVPGESAALPEESFLSEDEEKLLGSFDTEFETPSLSSADESGPLPDIEDMPPLEESLLSPESRIEEIEEIEEIGSGSVDIALEDIEGGGPAYHASSESGAIEDVSSEFLDLVDEPSSAPGIQNSPSSEFGSELDDVTAEFMDLEETSSHPRETPPSSDFEPLDIDLQFDDSTSLGASRGSPAASEANLEAGFEAVTEFDDFLTADEPEPSSVSEAFDDVSAVERELSAPAAVAQPGPRSGQQAERADLSNELLMKIAQELSSIRGELVSLKSRIGEVMVSADVSSTKAAEAEVDEGEDSGPSGGFFDEEEDETIALTGDELDNILNTADFTEEIAEAEQPLDLESELVDLEPSSSEASDLLEEILLPETGDYSSEDFSSKEAEPAIEEVRLGLADSVDEIAIEPIAPEAEDLSLMAEEGFMPMTAAPEDTSYLEAVESIDLGPPLTDEPLVEPDLSDLSDLSDFDLDTEELEPRIDIDEELPLASVEPLAEEDSYGDLMSESMAETLIEPEVEELTLGIDAGPGYAAEEQAVEAEMIEPIQEIEEPNFAEINLHDEGLSSEPSELEEIEFLSDSDLGSSFPPESYPERHGDVPLEEEDLVLEPEVEESPPPPPPPAARKQVAPPPAEQPARKEPAAKAGPSAESDDERLKNEIKSVLSYLDKLLESLPDDKIEEFARSEYFDTYKKLFEELGLV